MVFGHLTSKPMLILGENFLEEWRLEPLQWETQLNIKVHDIGIGLSNTLIYVCRLGVYKLLAVEQSQCKYV